MQWLRNGTRPVGLSTLSLLIRRSFPSGSPLRTVAQMTTLASLMHRCKNAETKNKTVKTSFYEKNKNVKKTLNKNVVDKLTKLLKRN